MKRINASIITIGDELLIGQVIDTNSAWMAQQLNKIGVWVQHRVAVGDVKDDIINALNEESKRSEIILITGGLGPTKDDITKPLLCEYFGGKLIVDEKALENVKEIFLRYLNRPLLDVNIKQAEVPDVCTVIQNLRGTAPGMWFEKDEKIFISMPGVPGEMQGMMNDFVLKELPKRFSLPFILHKTLITFGIGESFLAELIKDWENSLPANIKLAYLPNFGMVRLRLTSVGDDKNILEDELNKQFIQLKRLTAEYVIAEEDIPMQEQLGKILLEKNKTISTAESCTGGYIAHLITSVAGSSKYFLGSVVSYSNEVKESILSVSKNTIETNGAVSQETVIEMVRGVLQQIKSDYAVAVSGVMGPDGGSEKKPVGTVWVAVGNNKKIEARKFNFRFDRKKNIELTAMNAMNMMRMFILND